MQRRYVHGPGIDNPIAWYEGGTIGSTTRRFLMADERGSIVSVTDSTGATIAINAYDEYGIPGAGNAGRFGYTGQTWLPEVGMWYYKARMYSPTLGRFLQTDPIGYADGMNWYNYVGSDPVNMVDPSGLCQISSDGSMPCDWEHWPQWKKQSYCDQAKAVGCQIIDPIAVIDGKLYHMNNAQYDKDTGKALKKFWDAWRCGGSDGGVYYSQYQAMYAAASMAEAQRQADKSKNEYSWSYKPASIPMLGFSVPGFVIGQIKEGQYWSATIPGGIGYAGAGHSHIPDKGNGLGDGDPAAGARFLANNPSALFGLTT